MLVLGSRIQQRHIYNSQSRIPFCCILLCLPFRIGLLVYGHKEVDHSTNASQFFRNIFDQFVLVVLYLKNRQCDSLIFPPRLPTSHFDMQYFHLIRKSGSLLTWHNRKTIENHKGIVS